MLSFMMLMREVVAQGGKKEVVSRVGLCPALVHAARVQPTRHVQRTAWSLQICDTKGKATGTRTSPRCHESNGGGSRFHPRDRSY